MLSEGLEREHLGKSPGKRGKGAAEPVTRAAGPLSGSDVRRLFSGSHRHVSFKMFVTVDPLLQST